jgi:hypothetical protein
VTGGSKEKHLHGKALHFHIISAESSKIKNAERMSLVSELLHVDRACPCCTSLENCQNFPGGKCQEHHFLKENKSMGNQKERCNRSFSIRKSKGGMQLIFFDQETNLNF